MVDEIEKLLLFHWAEFGLQMPRPHSLSYLAINHPHTCKFLLHCIPDGFAQPCLLVKVAYAHSSFPLLKTEYTVLKQLYAHPAARNLAESLPKPLLYRRLGPNQVLVESYLPGVPLLRYTGKVEGLNRAAAWLIDFHSKVATWEPVQPHHLESMFYPALDYAVAQAKELETRLLLEEHRESLSRWVGEPMPFVCAHNDFIPSNLLFSRRGLGVVDWEAASFPGLAIGDLVEVCIRCAAGSRKLSYPRAFGETVLEPSGTWARMWSVMVRNYCARLGIPLEMMDTLIAQHLLDRAFRRLGLGDADLTIRQSLPAFVSLMRHGKRAEKPWLGLPLQEKHLDPLLS